MMRILSTFMLILISVISLYSQDFSVGYSTVTLNDDSRNREIPVQLYYPAETNGENVSWASGNFPLIVLGHGFAMNVTSYVNFCEFIVPFGFAVGMVDTENGLFSVSHEDYSLDLVFVSQSLSFPQIADQPFAFLGHSMGGGAAFLAASQSDCSLLIGWAPAETNPSAINAAELIECPVVVFSGAGDAVTPPEDNHLPMFNNASSACKAYISITGGAHCYFAEPTFTCDFGENAAGSEINITRAEQQEIVFSRMLLLLNAFLKSSQSDFVVFQQSVVNADGVEGIWECDEQPLGFRTGPESTPDLIYLSETPGIFYLNTKEFRGKNFEIIDLSGRQVESGQISDSNSELNLLTHPAGLYVIRCESKFQRFFLTPSN